MSFYLVVGRVVGVGERERAHEEEGGEMGIASLSPTRYCDSVFFGSVPRRPYSLGLQECLH